MSQVIYLPPTQSVGEALGKGIGAFAQAGTAEYLKKQQEQQSQEAIKAIQSAPNRETAFKLAADKAKSPAEFLQLSQAVANFFPETKPPKTNEADLLFTGPDGTKTVHKVQVTPDQESSSDALTKAFGQGRYKVSVASTADVPKEWIDSASGKYLGSSINKPSDTAVPLDVAKLNQQQQAEANKTRNQGLFNPDGTLKVPAANSINETIRTLVGTDPTTGGAMKPDPALVRDATQKAVSYLKSGQMDSTVAAASKAWTDAIKDNPPKNPIPLPPQKIDELRGKIYNYREAVQMIDKNLFSLGNATGVTSAGAALVNYIEGQATSLGTKISFPDTAKARAQLGVLQNLLTNELMQGNRFVTSEQILLKPLIPTPERWFANPQQAAEDLKAIRSTLVSRMQYAGQQIGADVPPPASTTDLIRQGDVQFLQTIDVNMLNKGQRRALDERLKELGY